MSLQVEGQAHDAVADCQATLALIRRMSLIRAMAGENTPPDAPADGKQLDTADGTGSSPVPVIVETASDAVAVPVQQDLLAQPSLLPDLASHARAVQDARTKRAEVKARFDVAMDGYLYAIRDLVNEKAEADQAVQVAEEAARAAVLEHYATTGSKHPGCGFGVRVKTVYTYLEEEALLYAIERRWRAALQLDAAGWENQLRIGNVPKADFARFDLVVKEVPTATIPTDLRKHLAAAE